MLPDYRWDVHKAQLSVSLNEGASISTGEVKNDRSPPFVQVFMLAFAVFTSEEPETGLRFTACATTSSFSDIMICHSQF